MKIEKISEDQVKFTLFRDDLIERNIKITELSYGSEKTQELFREMMEQAMIECDFHAESNTPLIIEAIPVSHDSIMIIVTKAANGEDIESKFSFSPKAKEERKYVTKPLIDEVPVVKKSAPGVFIFTFKSFEQAVMASKRLQGGVGNTNALYKNKGKYYLMFETNKKLTASKMQNLEYILSEYGQKITATPVSKTFLIEHGEIIIPEKAVDIMAKHL